MGEPVVATFSIVACDLETGQWGVAVQSKFLAVGSVVPWAEPEVGAIATQAYANPSYGPNGLSLLREGFSASEVVERLTAADDGRESRQLGVVDGVGDLEPIAQAFEAGRPVVVRAASQEEIRAALARPEVAAVLVPEERRDLLELDLTELTYG